MAAAIGLREWTLWADDYEDEAAFRAAVQTEAAMSEYLSYRLGIAVVSAPIRMKHVDGTNYVGWSRARPGEWETVGHRFETATVPAAVAPEQPAAPGAALDEVLDDEADDEPALEPEPADVSY
jgi:hypothetical protein